MRQDSADMQSDSARASRPYLFAQLVPGLAGELTWDLVIENTGRSGAFNTTMKIYSPIKSDDIVTQGAQRLAKSGVAIPPGGRIRTLWFVGASEFANPPEEMGYPSARISLNYSNADGQFFNDPSVEVEPNALGITPVPSTGPVVDSGSDEHALNAIHALRAIALHLGEVHR